MPLHFKKCTFLELVELVEISRRTFVDSFEKDNDPEDFKDYIDSAFEKSNIANQLKNPYSHFYFAFKDGQLAGYFKLNIEDAQTDINSEEAIELERIYVLTEFQGQKIGKHILQEAIRLASQLKKEYMWLGVWEKNTDAIRFYQKNGFTKFGTHPYYIGNDKQTDWLMRVELKKASPAMERLQNG
ncbi:GNAT family N-acetyltransferase [Maribacter algarum]|uniref:GNAT family N-acetyltransferase n=1 Tax=Maribacter algarum (ex Zhang et al. 2020) TaxID=2578118 RepID=A0A5S3PV43_9FLAO|nr:GNAT family N-acetyltransferase [Maribacter algarum]TMM58879.1 GNAT family N-acetyltransferase [Maribacter algarum]